MNRVKECFSIISKLDKISSEKLFKIFKDTSIKIFNELSSKYSINIDYNDFITNVVLDNSLDPNTPIASFQYDDPSSPDVAELVFNPHIAFYNYQFNSNSYKSLSLLVKDSAAHEICHAIHYLIDRGNFDQACNDKKLKGHNKLFEKLYLPYRQLYTNEKFKVFPNGNTNFGVVYHSKPLTNSQVDFVNNKWLEGMWMEQLYRSYHRPVIIGNIKSVFEFYDNYLYISYKFVEALFTTRNIAYYNKLIDLLDSGVKEYIGTIDDLYKESEFDKFHKFNTRNKCINKFPIMN